MFLHKYLGPKNPSEEDATADQPRYDFVNETNIQDLLFMENRDRVYDPNIYVIRGAYNVQDNDFNLTQFGLFFDSDILFVTVHINSSVKTIGRKIISGDVVELPHLKDEYALNDYSIALKRFYVVEDVTRAAEGYSLTWYPHLYRLKLKQITDSQEFKDIFDMPADEESPEGDTLRDVLSMGGKEKEINDKIIEQAEINTLKSGWDVKHYYHLRPSERGGFDLIEGEEVHGDTPDKLGYIGYFLGDKFAPNGLPFGKGHNFPIDAQAGDYFLREDFLPNRLFRFDGDTWVMMYDAIRHTLTNSDDRQAQKWTFINNKNITFQDKLASDSKILSVGDYIIDTDIDYPLNAKYLLLKHELHEKSYELSEFPDMITNSSDGKITIVLPMIDDIQDTIKINGQWDIYFYNHAEKERQYLRDALRPKADF